MVQKSKELKSDTWMIIMSDKLNKIKWFSWGLVLVWMGIIFFFSHQTASESSELSSGVMNVIFNIVSFISPVDISEDFLHFLVRKGAHFTVYFVLGVLIIHALFRCVHWKKDVIFATTISILYAISDEVHQLFIPGRSGEVRDVFIDSSGAIIGIFSYVLIRFFLLKRNR